jgi:MFS family permease
MASTAISDRDLRRVVIASLIGATIEWYDFFLYGTVAGIVFNKLFFPAQDPLISILLAYTTFAVGFVARPLGGVIFGHFGDRIGRKSMLILTLMIMGIATVLIGLLPTYQQIGVAAPIILLVLRVLQGIGLGGEWGGAVLMTYEYATEDRRGLFASLPQIGLSIGLCLSAGVVALASTLPEQQFLAWGWRIGFVASFVLVVVGLYIRLRIMETPEFSKLKAQGREVAIPFVNMIREYPRNVLARHGRTLYRWRVLQCVCGVQHLLHRQHIASAADHGVVGCVYLGLRDDLLHPPVRASFR